MTYPTVYCLSPSLVTLHTSSSCGACLQRARERSTKKGGKAEEKEKGTWSASRPTPACKTRPGLFKSVSERNLLENHAHRQPWKGGHREKCGKTQRQRGWAALPGPALACPGACTDTHPNDGTTDAATEEGTNTSNGINDNTTLRLLPLALPYPSPCSPARLASSAC